MLTINLKNKFIVWINCSKSKLINIKNFIMLRCNLRKNWLQSKKCSGIKMKNYQWILKVRKEESSKQKDCWCEAKINQINNWYLPRSWIDWKKYSLWAMIREPLGINDFLKSMIELVSILREMGLGQAFKLKNLASVRKIGQKMK